MANYGDSKIVGVKFVYIFRGAIFKPRPKRRIYLNV